MYFDYSTDPRTNSMTCLPCNPGGTTGINLGDCLECTNPNLCLRCNEKELVTVPNRNNSQECLDWCADREYRDADGVCRKCADGCLSCTGSSFRDCTGLLCNVGFEKTSTSPNGKNISCMKICKDGEFRNITNGDCSICGHNCFKCIGGEA